MNENMATTRRIYRSRTDRMLAGVSGGLGQYFNLDPVLFRLGFVLLTLTPGGFGLLAYILLAIVIPRRPAGEDEPAITSSLGLTGNHQFVGIVMLGIGAIMLASNLGLFWFFRWDLFWPLVLVAAGGALIARRVRQ